MRKLIEDQGFAIVPDVLTASALCPIDDSLTALESSQGRAGIRHLLSVPAVRDVAHSRPLLDIAESVLGRSSFPFRATLFHKSPETNWLVNWHQDTALPVKARLEAPGWGAWSTKEGVIYGHAPASTLEQIVALRLHLDDSTEQNGPLRVIPGSHRLGILKEEEIDRYRSRHNSEECLVGRGGVIAMRPLLLHASSKSRSQLPRRVLHFEYASAKGLSGGLELAIA